MLQLVIWMLCVYLVLKAIELWLIAGNAPEGTRGESRAMAGLFGVIAVLAAGFFFVLSLEQANQFNPPPSLY